MDPTFSFTVNGEARKIATPADRPLLDVIREDLHLTGAKFGCGEGMCRCCTVLMDGEPIMSCVTPVQMADGTSIVTIEGLAKDDHLHPLQEALMIEGMQCGYCANGMILTAAALLENTPHPSDEEIVRAMGGNLCRCCGYAATMRAIRRAAGRADADAPLHASEAARP